MVSQITLNNGVLMPALGLGVFLTPPEQTASSVQTALECGYRLIDTAAAYHNERQVSEGIARSGIERANLFVTTKLWLSDYGYESALRGFDASIERLSTDYVDLYLLHWPTPSEFDATVAAYKALEKLLADGRARAIGVCNFTPRHLEMLMSQADVVPAVNQVELHPFFTQPDVRAADSRHGVTTQSWSPIGGAYYRKAGTAKGPLEHPTVVALADKYGKTSAQIVLRWHIQHDLSPIPKSVRSERIADNIDIFDFALAGQDMAAIDALDTGTRMGSNPDEVASTTWAVRTED